MTNEEVLDGILLREHLVLLAKYSHDELFAKDLEGHKEDVEALSNCEKSELLEGLSKVDEKFEDGGRWYNWRTEILSTYFEGETRYISIRKQVPATEMQEGGDFESPEISIVQRKKVETYVYE